MHILPLEGSLAAISQSSSGAQISSQVLDPALPPFIHLLPPEDTLFTLDDGAW